ncbi:MAG: SRPBCC family protein [Ancalomicrobiaceae bacterium]|nr:SRPBCC family protein [Ancalomicrobiaceae bacterium]
MTTHALFPLDPSLDLVLDRVVDVSPRLVWAAWTRPDLLMQWFCPRPWKLVDCRLDLRPGGDFSTVMQGPDGQSFAMTGCYLELVENERLVFTDAMKPGFRPILPSREPGAVKLGVMAPLMFTAIVQFIPEGTGTRYYVTAVHGNAAIRQKHAEMGFDHGWAAALDQLVELMQGKA